MSLRSEYLMITKASSKVINFKIRWIPNNKKTLREPNCMNSENIGFLYKLIHRKVDFASVQFWRCAPFGKRLYRYSYGTKLNANQFGTSKFSRWIHRINKELFWFSSACCPWFESLLEFCTKRFKIGTSCTWSRYCLD